jgi:uncharacterized protein YicC (UPF0701 family)
MTAYAQVYKSTDSFYLEVILRSLNFKYLQITVHNLPYEKLLLEEKIKNEIKKHIFRGKIEVFLFLRSLKGNLAKIYQKYFSSLEEVTRKYNIGVTLNLSDLLHISSSLLYKEIKDDLVLSAVREGVSKLLRFKEREGRLIKEETKKNLRRLKENVEKINKYKPKEAEEKEDIDEEISLTLFYVKELEKKINSKTITKGKTIDFLTQEILRELNSASSKTKDKKISRLIVKAKDFLEKIREQAQNVE